MLNGNRNRSYNIGMWNCRKDLLRDTNSLSIQQMVTYYTLINVHKVTITGKPAYLAGRLKLRNETERELLGWGG